jgi:hypothetical protein
MGLLRPTNMDGVVQACQVRNGVRHRSQAELIQDLTSQYQHPAACTLLLAVVVGGVITRDDPGIEWLVTSVVSQLSEW